MAVRGLRQVQVNLGRVTRDIENAVVQAMEDNVLDLERRSKEQVPIDTGDLRGSGTSEVTEVYGGVKGTVSFNAGSADGGISYALIQHENMTFVHPKGGKAKYLTDPLNQNATKYRKHILEKTRRATR